MENKKMKSRDVVVLNRNIMIELLAININRIFSLTKVENIEKYSSYNKLKFMAHMLKNDFEKGIYLSEQDIENNDLTIKMVEVKGEIKKALPVITEYFKVVDEETGKLSYRYYNQYNIDQIEEKDAVYNLAEDLGLISNERKKYNLRKDNLENFFAEKSLDKLNRILFIGLIKMITGKEIGLNYKYDLEDKKYLVNLAHENPEYIVEAFKKTDALVKEYLENNELVKEEE